jgi:hypothetical protein
MRIRVDAEGLFLEHQDARIKLSPEDWRHLVKMTPLGRKVYFQNKGKTLRQRRAEDPAGEILLSWSRVPVRDWGFSCLP